MSTSRLISSHGLALSTACAASMFLAHAACAQDAPDEWKFTLGVGAGTQPKYPGSSERKTSLLPMLSANYGRYFIGAVPGAGAPAGVGLSLLRDEHWHIVGGLGANLSKPRKESDSPRLQGMGDINGTTLGSISVAYEDRWWKAGGNVVSDLEGKGQGSRITLNFELRAQPMDKLMISAGPSLTWADDRYTQTFFGVSAAQSARSGLAVYAARSGLNMAKFNVGAQYRLTPQWGLGSTFSAGRLVGDAANSPVTEKKWQNSVGMFASYHF